MELTCERLSEELEAIKSAQSAAAASLPSTTDSRTSPMGKHFALGSTPPSSTLQVGRLATTFLAAAVTHVRLEPDADVAWDVAVASPSSHLASSF